MALRRSCQSRSTQSLPVRRASTVRACECLMYAVVSRSCLWLRMLDCERVRQIYGFICTVTGGWDFFRCLPLSCGTTYSMSEPVSRRVRRADMSCLSWAYHMVSSDQIIFLQACNATLVEAAKIVNSTKYRLGKSALHSVTLCSWDVLLSRVGSRQK